MRDVRPQPLRSERQIQDGLFCFLDFHSVGIEKKTDLQKKSVPVFSDERHTFAVRRVKHEHLHYSEKEAKIWRSLSSSVRVAVKEGGLWSGYCC